jgi:hypothetical protein
MFIALSPSEVLKHPSPQQTSCTLPQPAPPLHEHVPALHISPELQVVPQVPQLEVSVRWSRQVVPQQICVVASQLVLPQTHWPPMHFSPDAHACPHCPQLVGSLSSGAQRLPQQTSPPLHTLPLQVHCPPAQTSGDAQAFPQVPQFASS